MSIVHSITTHHSSITTHLTHYGSYRTVVSFDSPMQNTIITYKQSDIDHEQERVEEEEIMKTDDKENHSDYINTRVSVPRKEAN